MKKQVNNYQSYLLEDVMGIRAVMIDELTKLDLDLLSGVVDLEDLGRADLRKIVPILERIRKDYCKVLDEIEAIKRREA